MVSPIVAAVSQSTQIMVILEYLRLEYHACLEQQLDVDTLSTTAEKKDMGTAPPYGSSYHGNFTTDAENVI